VQADGELSDSDDEGEGGRRNHMDRRLRVGSGFGIMDPMNKEKGPSVHHHLASVLGAGTGTGTPEEPSGDVTPKEGDSAAAEDDIKMEVDVSEERAASAEQQPQETKE
jgi:histone deacetylase 1/2